MRLKLFWEKVRCRSVLPIGSLESFDPKGARHACRDEFGCGLMLSSVSQLSMEEVSMLVMVSNGYALQARR